MKFSGYALSLVGCLLLAVASTGCSASPTTTTKSPPAVVSTAGPTTTTTATESTEYVAPDTSDATSDSSGDGSAENPWNSLDAQVALNSLPTGHGIIVKAQVGDFYIEKVDPDSNPEGGKFHTYSSVSDPGVYFDNALRAVSTLEGGLEGVEIYGYNLF